MFRDRSVIRATASLTVAIAMLPASPAPVEAGRVCDLAVALSLSAEERPLLDGRGGGVIVTGSPAPVTGLRPGDVLRQANGRRIERCDDLEAVAAEARAKGLLLLVAVERDGKLLTSAVATDDHAVAIVTAAPADRVAEAVPSSRAAEDASRAARATPTSTPAPVRETELPARAEASADLAAKAVAAAAVLGTVDAAARSVVPLAIYERRIEEATNAVAALRIDGDGSVPVQAVVDEALGYHRTARDIRRSKAEALTHARVDPRSAAGSSMPYFSDSEVPRWMERYPFLGATLQQAPRTTHVLLPGEMAGRWDPDRAVELLWERAAKAAARLAAWGAGA